LGCNLSAGRSLADMPRYFFDLDDGAGASRDREGTELPDLEAAKAEAAETAAAIGKERFPQTDEGSVRIEIRNGTDRPLMRIELRYSAKTLT
jgi:hypothetical protein